MSLITSANIPTYNNKVFILDALKDTTRQYNAPEDVAADNSISNKYKRKILENWKLDAEALLRAEEENMLSTSLTNAPSRLLQKINDLLAEL